jgi:ribose/xylose/arabinose/galactoside ABC-type transport system permease subunit
VTKWQWAWEGALGVIAVLAVGTVLVTAPLQHLVNVLALAAPLGLAAVALSLSVRTGSPNLAVGAVSALCGGLMATAVVEYELPLAAGVLLVLALAAFAGLVLGAFTVLLNAPSWAVTLTAALVCEALLVMITGGSVIVLPSGSPFPLVAGFVVFAVLSVAGGAFWLNRNVRERLSKGWAGGLLGLAGSNALAALGGFALLMRLGAAQPSGQGLFTVVFALAAVVLGGTSLNGERGAVAGTLLAVLILAIVQGQLILMNAPSYAYMLVLGAVVALGLTVSRLLDALRD